MKRIALLTSGGDAPGMNAAIRSVARTGIYYGLEMIGIFYGYQGLMENQMIPLDLRSVGDIIQRGGTLLKTSRAPAFLNSEGRKKAYDVLEKEAIEGLIAIGGDGTFRGALEMTKEGKTVIGIPGTIDNDIPGTEYTIGFDTAVNTVVEAMNKIRDTATSHERVFIIEVMGRYSGNIALQAGLAGGAEAILLPEVTPDLGALVQSLQNSMRKGKKFSIILVAEGVMKATQLQTYLKESAELETWVTVLGHLQRGGTPSVTDRIVAAHMGSAAVEALLRGEKGKMVTWNCNQIGLCDFEEMLTAQRIFDLRSFKLANRLSI